MRVPNGGEALHNPADDPAMRYRTGLDPDVYAHVLATPGARELVDRTDRLGR
ncbi:hypothetical protein ACIQZB_44440 [Streptomyces sp. NPDC097727]|uniref:hypothetical protein n=1 Tax=Streptomyces sp. NPDC097727 TaxID=3366092 RepID=UPI0037FF31D0